MELNQVKTTVPVVQRTHDFPECPINPNAETTGFLLDFDTSFLPTSGKALSEVIDLKYSLTQHFTIANWGDLSIEAVNVCSSSQNCEAIYATKSIDGSFFSSRTPTPSRRPFVRYLVQIS